MAYRPFMNIATETMARRRLTRSKRQAQADGMSKQTPPGSSTRVDEPASVKGSEATLAGCAQTEERSWRAARLGSISAVLLSMAFPPVGWWPLAWVAPVAWCILIGDGRLAGNRPYRTLYVCGLVHWLLVLHWVRLPHWSAYFGWIVLCGYLAIYVPLFVAISRQFVHRWRVPLVLAAPITWCGLEYVRGYFATGFSMALLGHTQIQWLEMIQVADLGGAYLVSFLIMLVASGIAQCSLARTRVSKTMDRNPPSPTLHWLQSAWPIVFAFSVIACAWGYGDLRLRKLDAHTEMGQSQQAKSDAIQVALIQGSRITTFSGKDDRQETIEEYQALTRQAVLANPAVDVVVWPESMLMVPWLEYTWPVQPPAYWPQDPVELRPMLRYMKSNSQDAASWIARQFGKQAIVGTEAFSLNDQLPQRFNRAMHVDAQGHVDRAYDKMHPVMFGEYVPLGNLFPWLYKLTPMGNGLNAGRAPVTFAVGKVRLCPCICYENTVPHLIRSNLRRLIQSGENPHAMITITNDGWFWGSSQLDLHLACGIFRAIEMRRAMLIAANTGMSADIAPSGRIRSRGDALDETYLIAQVSPSEPVPSVYLTAGDWFAGGSACACLLGLVGCMPSRRTHAAV